MLDGLQIFYREFRDTFKTTGAIVPSSPALARAITQHLICRGEQSIRVLEAGPGTGSFTIEILKYLKPGDQFDVYELNPRFHRYLKKRFPWSTQSSYGISCQLFNADVRDLAADVEYDFIICGLPFNNFEPELVSDLLKTLVGHLSPGGIFSYFEYIFSHEFKAKFLKEPSERRRMIRVGSVIRQFVQDHQFDYQSVWLNLPPARARYCRKQADLT